MNRAALVCLVLAACGGNPVTPQADGADDTTDPIDARGAADATDAAPDAAPDAGGPLPGDPFAALVALAPTCSADAWCWRTPTPAGNDYSRVFSTAPDNIWLIGQHGTVMQWDGAAWTSHHPPVLAGQPAAQYPLSIGGLGPADMWLVYGSTVQHWDGSAWTIRDSLTPSGIIAFSSIWAAPDGDAWATMNTGTVRRYHPDGSFVQLDVGCGGCFLGSIWGVAGNDFFITKLPAGILHYNGAAFTPVYGGPLIAGSYTGTAGDVWVSGADGAMLHWDGAAWTTHTATGLGTGWYISAMAALAGDDVWWWASRSSVLSAFVHWDGTALTTTPVETTAIGASLYAGAIIDDRWWLVGGAGAVYTRTAPDAISAVVDPQVMSLQAMWGSADDDMYFATGGEIRHWDGATTTVIPIPARAISGVRTDGVDELFAAGYTLAPDLAHYIAVAYHFDGTSWTTTPLDTSTLAEHRYVTQVFAIGPGEALAVGYRGLAYRFHAGAWTPVTTGVAADLMGVWGPTPDQVWITGSGGTLLRWSSENPTVATRDPTLVTTTDLGAIHGAGGTTWIAAPLAASVWRNDGSGWTQLSSLIPAGGVFAIDATNAVFASSGQSQIARWNGTDFALEDNASGMPTPVVFRPSSGPLLAGGLHVLVQHP